MSNEAHHREDGIFEMMATPKNDKQIKYKKRFFYNISQGDFTSFISHTFLHLNHDHTFTYFENPSPFIFRQTLSFSTHTHTLCIGRRHDHHILVPQFISYFMKWQLQIMFTFNSCIFLERQSCSTSGESDSLGSSNHTISLLTPYFITVLYFF